MTIPVESVRNGFLPLPERQRRRALMGVVLALSLAALSQTVVATAMPGIIVDLGGFDRYTWPAAAYLCASIVAIPIAGRLADLYGRRLFFILGIAIFVLGAVPAAMSLSMNQLIASRALQGIGSGIIVITSTVAIADLFPPRERGKFLGLLSLVYGIAAVVGPTLGGLITDHLSWTWIFVLQVPAGIVVLLLIARTFPRVRSRTADTEPGSPSAVVLLTIHARRMVAVGAVVMFLSGIVMYGSVLFVPLFFQAVLGASATSSGAFLTPLMLAVVLGAVVSGWLLSRAGARYRVQGVITTVLMFAGAYLLSTMDTNTSFAQAVGYIGIMGLGLGGAMILCNTAVQNSVPYELVGTATSALQFHRLVGGTVGLGVMGAVMAKGFSWRLEGTGLDAVRAALRPGWFDALKENPRVLMDSSAPDTLGAAFGAAGAVDARLAEMLLDALRSALAGAVGDALALGAAAAALSVVAALFIRMRSETRDETLRS